MTCNNPDCPRCYPHNHHKPHDDHEQPTMVPDKKRSNTQTHVHEFAGSTMIAGIIPHNHRFAGVTSEEIPCGDTHVHAILVNTDFFFNHYHEVGIRTGPPYFHW